MSKEIVEAVRGLAAEKNISHEKLMEALEDALLSAYKKTPGSAPYAKVVQDRGYPEGSILDAFLTSEKLKEEGGIWPILNSISVHYGYIDDRWFEHNPSGFHIAVEFVASTKEEIGGNQMYFYAASGLDPLQSSDGKVKVLDGFKAQDTIEGIREPVRCDVLPIDSNALRGLTQVRRREEASPVAGGA